MTVKYIKLGYSIPDVLNCFAASLSDELVSILGKLASILGELVSILGKEDPFSTASEVL